VSLANRTLIVPVFAAILVLSLAGCYTLIKHPNVAESPAEADFGRCTDCHDRYFHPGPYDPDYPDPWWMYYELPWWYNEVVVVPEMDSLGSSGHRSIIAREPIKRPIDGSGIGFTAPGGGGTAGAPVMRPLASPDSSIGTGTMIKKHTGSESRGDARSIDERSATKRGSDEKQSGDAKDTKKEQSSDSKDTSKASDNTKESKEKKKEQQ